MTGKQFTGWAEAVFGKYNLAMKTEVEKWLDAEWDEDEIDALRHVALREHPSVYGKPPGYHEIEEMRETSHKLCIEARPKQNLVPREEAQYRGDHVPFDFEAAWKRIVKKVK